MKTKKLKDWDSWRHKISESMKKNWQMRMNKYRDKMINEYGN